MDPSRRPSDELASADTVLAHADGTGSSGVRGDGSGSAALPRGTLIGRYVVLGMLGEGGMGVVYSAYDTQLDRKIAVKLLRHDLREAPHAEEIRLRMLREAQAMARLSHPNVVAIHDVGMFDGSVFLAMEYVDGVTLREWVATDPPPRERLDLMRAAGRGLLAAHEAGLVHRDFKPDNVLVGRDGRVRVTDFGLARGDASDVDVPSVARPPPAPSRGGGASLASPSFDSQVTEVGVTVGTVGFMAPEQARGELATPLSDQWSYAATLYFAAYGEAPFAPDVPLAEQDVIPEPTRGRTVPSWLYRVIVRGLSRSPGDRFPSMADMLAALEEEPRIRRRRWAWGLGAGALAASGIVVVSLLRPASVCLPDPHDLDGVWSAAMAGDVRRTFAASGVPDAPGIAERVTRKIDEWTAKWVEEKGEACRAALVRKKEPADVYRLRTACLERERTEGRAITALLASADRRVVRRAVSLAYGLPDLAWCADVAALKASVGLPDDPAKRDQVALLNARLAKINAGTLAGRVAEVRAEAHELVQVARDIDYPPTVATALYYEGRTLTESDEPAAYPLFREAFWTAMGAGDHALAVRVGELAAGDAVALGQGGEAHMWIDASRAAFRLAGMQARDVDRLPLLRAEAYVAGELDRKPDVALALDEQIVAIERKLLGAHPLTAGALTNLAVNRVLTGDPLGARPLFEEALAMRRAIEGPDGMGTGEAEDGLGACLVQLGAYEEGERTLVEAVRVFDVQAAKGWIADALSELIRAHVVRGDAAGALPFVDRALPLLGTYHDADASIGVQAGEALTDLGRSGEALPLCEKALRAQEKARDIDPAKVYLLDALRCEAEALTALGRPVAAIPLLERSLTLKLRAYPADYARTQFALARALAATKQDPDRVASLARAAREELARFPPLAFEIGRVERFLRE